MAQEPVVLPFKVLEITKEIFPEGKWQGVPSIKIKFDTKAEGMDFNSVVDTVNKMKLKHIVIEGKIKEFPNLLDLVKGFVQTNRIVSVITDSTDTTERMRILPNARVFIDMVLPHGQENAFDQKLFSLLKEDDEIKMGIKTIKNYQKFLELMKGRVCTKPTILFNIDQYRENVEEFLKQYFIDCIDFRFKSRISFSWHI